MLRHGIFKHIYVLRLYLRFVRFINNNTIILLINCVYLCLQFDRYLRSMCIDPDSPNFRLVTDGPLPLRQCLHPEACAKDIDLPPYYCRYSDLRKEFVRYNSDDLSRALIPVKDAKKLPNMPALPAPPPSIADMMNGKCNNFVI